MTDWGMVNTHPPRVAQTLSIQGWTHCDWMWFIFKVFQENKQMKDYGYPSIHILIAQNDVANNYNMVIW
jgi:hypothetical protein